MGIREVSAAFNLDYPIVPTHVGVDRSQRLRSLSRTS